MLLGASMTAWLVLVPGQAFAQVEIPQVDDVSIAEVADETAPGGEPTSITAQADERRSPWAESRVSYGLFMGATTFDRSFEQSYDPYVAQVVSLDPRFKATEDLTFSASLDAAQELTNSATTTREHEPVLGDLDLSASYALPALPGKVKPGLGLSLGLPTSKQSRARDRYFTLSGLGAVSRAFELGGGTTLTPSVGVRADWYAAGSDVLTSEAPYLLCQPACGEFNYGGDRSPQYALRQSAGLAASFPHELSASLQVQLIQSRLFDLEPATGPSGMPIPMRADSDDWRYIHAYVAAAEWRAHKHFALGTGLQTVNGARRSDGTLRTPLVNRFTQFFVTASAVY